MQVAKSDIAPRKKTQASEKQIEKLEQKNAELKQEVKQERRMSEKLARENA